MLLNSAFFIFITNACAWSYFQGISTGAVAPEGNVQQTQLFEAAAASPNSSAYYPINIGATNVSDSFITFHVNISDIALLGVDQGAPGIDDPRAVLVTYSISALNDSTLAYLFNDRNTTCATILDDVLPSNKYNGAGDCTSVMGSDCVLALRDLTESNTNCSVPFSFPASCLPALKSTDGSYYSGTFGEGSTEDNQTSNSRVLFTRDSVVLSPKDSKTQYEQAATGVQFAMLKLDGTPVPVCIKTSAGLKIQIMPLSWLFVLVLSVLLQNLL